MNRLLLCGYLTLLGFIFVVIRQSFVEELSFFGSVILLWSLAKPVISLLLLAGPSRPIFGEFQRCVQFWVFYALNYLTSYVIVLSSSQMPETEKRLPETISHTSCPFMTVQLPFYRWDGLLLPAPMEGIRNRICTCWDQFGSWTSLAGCSRTSHL